MFYARAGFLTQADVIVCWTMGSGLIQNLESYCMSEGVLNGMLQALPPVCVTLSVLRSRFPVEAEIQWI